MGYWIGWFGVAFGLLVPLPQLVRIFRTKSLVNISLGTYTLLIMCLCCYLVHAIYIKSEVFATAQSINLLTNGSIWTLLMLNKFKGERWNRRLLKRLVGWLPKKSQS